MFWWIAKILLYLLTLVVCLYVAREIMVLLRIHKYKKQGIQSEYVPFLGIFFKMMPNPKNDDQLGLLKQVLEKNKKEAIFVTNYPIVSHPSVWLLNDELVREFYLKEIEHTIKWPEPGEAAFGFFFENGPHVFEMRSLYSAFFNFDNIRLISESVSQIVQDELKKFKAENFKQEAKVQVFTKELIKPILSTIVNKILMGNEGDEVPKIHGHDICHQSFVYLDNLTKASLDVANVLSCGYAHHFRLLATSRASDKKLKELEAFSYKQLKKREQEGFKPFPNILDTLVRLNLENKKRGLPELTQADVGGHCNLFQVAGSDTSMEVTTTALQILSENLEVQTAMREMSDKILNNKNGKKLGFDDYNSDEKLDNYINEFLRLGTAFAVMSTRVVTKDMTIGRYKLFKGSLVSIPGQIGHTCTRFAENAAQFDGERLNAENRRKVPLTGNMPFGSGRRICIGKALGELIVRTILVHVVRDFKIHKADRCDMHRDFVAFYNWRNPSIALELRK